MDCCSVKSGRALHEAFRERLCGRCLILVKPPFGRELPAWVVQAATQRGAKVDSRRQPKNPDGVTDPKETEPFRAVITSMMI